MRDGDTRGAPAAAGSSRSPSARWWPLAGLAAAAFLVHARSLGFTFTPLDDRLLILDRLAWLGDPSNALAAFREGVFLGKEQNFYRPLLTLSFMADTVAGGGAAWVYHLTNVLLHAVAVLLVLAVLVHLRAPRRVAFVLALLFAVHPASAPAVAWLPGRNDTLLAVLVLGAFLAFERWRAAGGNAWAAAHVALLFLALLTKESAAALVPLLASWTWLDRRGKGRSSARSLVPIGAGWLAALLAWFLLRRAYGGTSSPLRIDAAALGDFGAALVLLHGKLVAPVSQSVMPVVADSSLWPGVLGLVATVAIARAAGFHDGRVAAFGLAWFAAFLLLPTLAGSAGVVMPIHHEHRLYVAAVGFLAAAAQLRFERLAPRRWMLAALAGALVLAAGAKTFARSAAYADALAFASRAVLESPSLAVAHKMRSDVYLDEKQYELARADAERALALRPGYGGALSTLGKAHFEAGRPAEALDCYTRAIAAEPGELEHRNNRAFVHLALGASEQALADLDFVLARDPRNWKALNNRGKALIYTGQPERAAADLTAAIALRPEDGEPYHNRAVALFYLEDYDRAWADVERAQARGIPVTPAFLEALRKASGR